MIKLTVLTLTLLIGPLNFRELTKLSTKKKVVKGLLTLELVRGKIYRPCQQGKQRKSQYKPLLHTSTSSTLELLHMDLMGLMQTLVGRGLFWYMMMIFQNIHT